MPGKCKFQESWLEKAAFKDWLAKDAGDIYLARCRACCKSIKLQTMGEAALTSHAGSASHKTAVRMLLEGKIIDTGQIKDEVNQADNSKEQIAICFQREALERITGSNWADLHQSATTNSISHNAVLKDATFPTPYFTAPEFANQLPVSSRQGSPVILYSDLTGTSRLINQHLHLSDSEKEDALHDTLDLSRLEQQQRADTQAEQHQMKILEWENRMKVLAWEQELMGEKMKASRQKRKAFRMKKIYYRAKLKKLGEDVSPSSSSSGEEEENAELVQHF